MPYCLERCRNNLSVWYYILVSVHLFFDEKTNHFIQAGRWIINGERLSFLTLKRTGICCLLKMEFPLLVTELAQFSEWCLKRNSYSLSTWCLDDRLPNWARMTLLGNSMSGQVVSAIAKCLSGVSMIICQRY